MSGTLYIVGTPIGNLGDFSPRAVEILQSVDFIAAEDTRVTLKLLNHFGIKKPMISYFEHNRFERGEIICQRLENGENAALVSDAGMPAISDPGELLVKQCAQRDIPVLAVPGPSAVVTALAVSGLPTGRFSFEGFLSTNRTPHTGILRSAPQAVPHPVRFVRGFRGSAHCAGAGADENPRGGVPHHTVGGHCPLRCKPAPGRVCAGDQGRAGRHRGDGTHDSAGGRPDGPAADGAGRFRRRRCQRGRRPVRSSQK